METASPNLVSLIALLSWPLVALFLYSTRPVAEATIWTILGGYLLLPVGTGIEFEGIPTFDKTSIPNLAAIIGCVLVTQRIPLSRRFGLAEILMLMLVVGAFLTSELNRQPTVVAGRILPGLDSYEGLSAAFNQLIFIIPLILGRQFLSAPADTVRLLSILLTAGLAYSLLMLFEIRMSPQLHTWIYGYFPHSFAPANTQRWI